MNTELTQKNIFDLNKSQKQFLRIKLQAFKPL